MEHERSSDTLSRYIIYAAAAAIICALCWYFRSVIVYILGAFVVSLVGLPLIKVMKKVRIKGKAAPDWLLAILAIILVLSALVLIITEAVPPVVRIISDASSANVAGNGNPLDKLNSWITDLFPALGSGFRVEKVIMEKIREALDLSSVGGFLGNVIGSMASIITGVAVATFSVIFISFFFLKDDKLFSKIVCALVPDKHEENVRKAISDIEYLLSRYFVGLIVEMMGVALIDFLGLWGIARIGAGAAFGIAFIAGLLNVIPYVGPLIGELIGVILALIIKISTGAGLDVNIWIFAVIVLSIMVFAQLIDNFVYQPVIYSTSIKASPLEIFIVLLMAGTMGGVVGMLLAIPAYTVVRVIAGRFFRDYKPIRRLIE
ncbi:MAG: AI-2E family transporter [Bacteroidales bacterium]|nr:AI-2E family transporter [Bacteroidales bacterium]